MKMVVLVFVGAIMEVAQVKHSVISHVVGVLLWACVAQRLKGAH